VPKKFRKSHKAVLLVAAAIIVAAVWSAAFVQYRVMAINNQGFALIVGSQPKNISGSSIGFAQNGWGWISRKITGKAEYNSSQLNQIITQLQLPTDQAVHNFGVTISGSQASLDLQSASGYAIDHDATYKSAATALDSLRANANIALTTSQPTVTMASAENTLALVKKIMVSGLTLTYQGSSFQIPESQIGTWIVQTPNGTQDQISFNGEQITTDILALAKPLDQQEQDLDFSLSGTTVTDFQAPKDGITVDTDQAVAEISRTLQDRELGDSDAAPSVSASTLVLSLKTVTAGVSARAQSYGVRQLIGSAATPFTGSTKNRIINIKNGAAKLNGVLINPNENFSTIGTLGVIDQTTGYVEELVILGPQTVPAYGGGLCQVSTTLFRAVLNTGLPVTARQPHEYRVSYYEKDANGKSIGPGLDATIYDPAPDFRFLNDTGNNILLTDEIVGTKLIFNFWGTSDGRTASVDGPHTLEITPAPPAETVYSATAAPGLVKQTEFAIKGAVTDATYTIHYANGTVKAQDFKSVYHGMPAIYITNTPPVDSGAPAATVENELPGAGTTPAN
jgi:vancomycin resistance protein YoaR